jgi:hypothetical protein
MTDNLEDTVDYVLNTIVVESRFVPIYWNMWLKG